MKKVIVIGSGVAGLSAAIYARRSGFDTLILEQHTSAGGLCCSWRRGDFIFEGGMHWLTGSSDRLTLHKVWLETGALQENNPITYRDPIYAIIDPKDVRPLALYRSIERTRECFLSYAPEDKKVIAKLLQDIRAFLLMRFIISDIRGLKTKHPMHPSLSEILGVMRVIPAFFRLLNISLVDYIAKFNNRNIRALLMSVIGYRYNALSLIYSIASFMSGDCGYPEGGSTRLIGNMLETFKKTGGVVRFKSKVTSVVIENRCVKAVMVGDERIDCDAVIVTSDAKSSTLNLFGSYLKTVPHSKRYSRYRDNLITEQNIFIALGVDANLSAYDTSVVLPLDTPFCAGGLEFTELRLNIYCDEGHALCGGSAITCLLLGDSYDYWKGKKEEGTYKACKDALAEAFIKTISLYIAEVIGKVKIIDVATPLTYERYCSCYHGSWMSVWPKGKILHAMPIKVPGTKGLYFAGQRNSIPGGLPCAAASGRLAAQYLCRDNKCEFVTCE